MFEQNEQRKHFNSLVRNLNIVNPYFDHFDVECKDI